VRDGWPRCERRPGGRARSPARPLVLPRGASWQIDGQVRSDAWSGAFPWRDGLALEAARRSGDLRWRRAGGQLGGAGLGEGVSLDFRAAWVVSIMSPLSNGSADTSRAVWWRKCFSARAVGSSDFA